MQFRVLLRKGLSCLLQIFKISGSALYCSLSARCLAWLFLRFIWYKQHRGKKNPRVFCKSWVCCESWIDLKGESYCSLCNVWRKKGLKIVLSFEGQHFVNNRVGLSFSLSTMQFYILLFTAECAFEGRKPFISSMENMVREILHDSWDVGASTKGERRDEALTKVLTNLYSGY